MKIEVQGTKPNARFLICLLLFTLPLTKLIGQDTQVTGEGIQMIKNRSDIYHPKNEEFRKELINLAVIDAIEKGGIINIKSIDVSKIKSTKEKSFEDVYEDFLSVSLHQYNVEWQRKSNYIFTPIESKNGKKWKCEVDGIIRNIEPGFNDIVGTKDQSRITNKFVTKKNYNIVFLNSGIDDTVKTGDKFVVYRQKRIKTVNGFHVVPQQVGLVMITMPYSGFSKGRILKGVYGVHESQLVKKSNFKTFRFGLEYQLSGSYEQINSTDYGLKSSSINTTSHSLFLSHYSYVSRTGFKFGLEFMDTEISNPERDTSTFIFIPKFNWNFSIGLVPDILYLNPEFSIGYLFGNFSDKSCFFTDPQNKWGSDVVLEAGLSAHIRFKFIDFIGGFNYKYINDYQELKNIYPYAGIMFNFVRYVPKDFSVD